MERAIGWLTLRWTTETPVVSDLPSVTACPQAAESRASATAELVNAMSALPSMLRVLSGSAMVMVRLKDPGRTLCYEAATGSHALAAGNGGLGMKGVGGMPGQLSSN